MRSLTMLLTALLAFTCHARVGYYQQPTVHGNRIVFEAEGDLWRAPLVGGAALRLTTHAGIETTPAISPDGRWLAFVGAYDEGPEVYVMPLTGGAPQRLTWGDEVLSVEGWTPDGRVLYVTDAAYGTVRHTLVREIDPTTLATGEWPLAGANQAAVAPDGTRWFTRNGLHRTGDHARRYRGGAMAQLWRFAAGADEAERLLQDLEANLLRPLWAGDRLYFLADPDDRFELWSVDAAGADLRRHVAHEDRDIRHAATDGATIVYQLGADLYRHVPGTGRSERIDLSLTTDLDGHRVRWLDSPLDWATATGLGPAGERVVVTVRGRLATFGRTGEPRIELPLPAEARARQAVFGADGERVFAFLSRNGRDQLVALPANGAPSLEVLVDDGASQRLRLAPDPSGRYLAHTDHDGNLWLHDLEDGSNRHLDHWPEGDDSISDLAWSPDGSRLAWVRPAATTRIAEVVLHDLERDERRAVTSDRFPARSPVFSRDGRFIYFLTDRAFDAQPGAPWGDRNMGPAFDRRAMVLALALDPNARFPFLAKHLGPAPAVEENEDEDEGRDDDEDEDQPAALVWDGLADRLYEVPVAPGNYAALAATEGHLLVLDRPLLGDPVLTSISIDPDAKTETFATRVADFAVTTDGKRVYFRAEDEAFLVDAGAKAPEDRSKQTVDFAGWRLAIDPRAEWRQMFDDAWRMHRAFAFDAKFRGLDWEAVRARYAPLVDRVGHRSELDDLLGEMTAELGILHSQVGRAELPEDDEQPVAASLAATFEPVAGGLRVTTILDGDPDLPAERSPLSRPEVAVRIGDVLRTVDHRPVTTAAELHEALLDQAGRPVLLEMARGTETRSVRVAPIPASELPRRRYRAWEQDRRRRVDAQSDGAIGYLHLYAMGSSDIEDFAREFFPQLRRQGLIIDVRNNRGGNVDAWVINALLRRVWAFWQTAAAEEASSENMQAAFRGHLAVVIDEYTYSDGETFAAGIRALDLAPLIGQRTAGAGIWLSDRNTLADGGIARVAEFAQYGLDGRWLIEGRGIAPDIAVAAPPHAVYGGADPQLDRAVAYLLERIEAEPVPALRGEEIPGVGTPGKDVR